MPRTLVALLAAVGIASTASAQATLSVRAWNGSAWSANINTSGGTIHCAMFIGFNPGYGLAGAVYNIQGTGMMFTDSVDIASAGLGRTSAFNFGAASEAIFTANGGFFRIDDAGDAANSVVHGISSAQESPSQSPGTFSIENPALVYKFDLLVNGTNDAHAIDLSVPLNQLKNGVVAVYSAANSTHGTDITSVTTSGATINVVVPAPASIAMLGLGGLLAGRRKR